MARRPSVNEILDLLSRRPAGGHQEVVDLATGAPEVLPELVIAAAGRLTRSSTAIEAALELVDSTHLDAIASAAVDALRRGLDPNSSQAASLVALLSLQAPSSLQPHLRELWRIRPNRRSSDAAWPWRAATTAAHLEPLESALHDPDEAVRRFAWTCLLESRTEAGQEAALAAIGSVVEEDDRVGVQLGLVGIERTSDGFRRLFAPPVAHIEFPPGFLVPAHWPSVDDDLEHPTWHLGTQVVGRGRFGGAGDGACAVCDQRLHRLLAIDEAPVGVQAPSEVVTCMSCLGWTVPVLFFTHDSGTATPAGGPLRKEIPRFPADPLPHADVVFRRTPDRWRLQDVGASNGRQNLHRLGGEPTWVQVPEHPVCPGCDVTMPFVLQIDSLDIAGGPWWLWGSGGILYAFWCTGCSISATAWQCT